jgi:mono/diheme cytochrome c family protein
MKKLLRVGLFVFVGLVVLVGAGYAWASRAAAQTLSRSFDAHDVDFPIPFPLGDEVAQASEPAEGEAPASAEEAAIERGRHLTSARYGCTDCHGEDFSGGVMMDAMPVARAFGPNLTLGEGSVVRDYTAADWDRTVRHGIGPGGRPLVMPSLDFQYMSDQELSDIVVYIRSLPRVDNEMPARELGPIGKFLVARGDFRLSVDQIPSHDTPHDAMPPEAVADVAFGRHLAATCMGCHKSDFTGGEMGGDPSWAPAANLTTGNVDDWTLEEFKTLLRTGVRPDGTSVLVPMTFVMPYAQGMTEVEIEAIYLFLRSLPAKETQD